MRVPHRLSVKPIPKSARPTAVAETMIVLLCKRREEKKPDPRSEVKYPAEINRKRDPASPWVIPRSFSMAGIKGARIILEIKFRKKIVVKKSRGPICEPKEGIFLSCLLAGSRLVGI